MNLITKAGAQSASAPFTFVLSTGDVDRMGDVVVQKGISLTAFRKNPVALFAHNSRMPIGTWENIRREGDALIADLKLAARGTSRIIDELRSLIEQKILRATSIGFGVIKSEPLDPEKPYGGQRYTQTELMEASLVAVPANPNALALRSLSPEMRALLSDDSQATANAGIVTRADVQAQQRSQHSQGTKQMNLAEKIKAARARIDEIVARASELQQAAEQGSLTDEQSKEIDSLSQERETVEKSLASFEALERVSKERATPAGLERAGAPAVIRRTNLAPGGDEPKGTLVARLALAAVYQRISGKPLIDVAREQFVHDPRIEAIVKTATPMATTTQAGWAKELVQTDIQGFIDFIAPVSAYAALSSRGFTVNFGEAGSISIPYRAGTNTDVAGAFVGENGVIPVKRATINAQTLNRYKMAVITTLTKELARASTPQAETLLRRFMADDTAVALDKAFLDAQAAVAGIRPAGILAGVAAIPASAAPANIDKAIADLKALVGALVAAGNGARPVFLMNPAQKLSLSLMYAGGIFVFANDLAGGRIMGAEVVTSTNVPVGDVILIDAANFATGLGTPEFDASDTATLVMANADGIAPTQATLPGDRTVIGTAEQVPPDGGISVRDPAQQAVGKVGEGSVAISLFQQWAIGLRTVLPVSWGLTRAGSVAWVDNVGW